MPGVGQIDAIETVTFRHAEGNEGEKNGVKRGNGGFFGAKLLKRQGQLSALSCQLSVFRFAGLFVERAPYFSKNREQWAIRRLYSVRNSYRSLCKH